MRYNQAETPREAFRREFECGCVIVDYSDGSGTDSGCSRHMPHTWPIDYGEEADSPPWHPPPRW